MWGALLSALTASAGEAGKKEEEGGESGGDSSSGEKLNVRKILDTLWLCLFSDRREIRVASEFAFTFLPKECFISVVDDIEEFQDSNSSLLLKLTGFSFLFFSFLFFSFLFFSFLFFSFLFFSFLFFSFLFFSFLFFSFLFFSFLFFSFLFFSFLSFSSSILSSLIPSPPLSFFLFHRQKDCSSPIPSLRCHLFVENFVS